MGLLDEEVGRMMGRGARRSSRGPRPKVITQQLIQVTGNKQQTESVSRK